MKDGTVAETGTHEELMLKNGDYAELYNIQASAFSSETSSSSKEKLGISEVHVTNDIKTSPVSTSIVTGEPCVKDAYV